MIAGLEWARCARSQWQTLHPGGEFEIRDLKFLIPQG